MWTDGARRPQTPGHARACVGLSAFSPTAAFANASVHGNSLAAGVEHGRRDTITTRVLAAAERCVGDLQDTLHEASLAGRHVIQPAQLESPPACPSESLMLLKRSP
jgi:hypothetical protein